MLNNNFLAQHPGLEAALATDHYIVRSIFDQFKAKGRLSDKQVALVLKLAADAAKPKEELPPSEYQGTVGVRQQFSVRLLKVVTFEAQYGFATYGNETRFMHLFRDELGNDYKWVTGARLATVNGSAVEEGDWYRITATVKAHQEYKGRKQTVINRVKLF